MPLLSSRKSASTPASDPSEKHRPSDWMDRLARRELILKTAQRLIREAPISR